MTGDKLLSKIPGELLHLTRNGLPQPPPDGPDTQRVIIRLPDGACAEVTFVKLKSKKGKMSRWFWSPNHARILEK